MDLLNTIQEFLTDFYESFSHLSYDGKRLEFNFKYIIKKATEDREYRKSLLKNPRRILRQEGFNLHEEFNIHFIENTEETIHIPILPFLKEDSAVVNSKTKMVDEHHILGKALLDSSFRERLISKPEETLQREGIAIPGNKKIKVVECTDELLYVVLPPLKIKSPF
jgi:hypothetical protein